mmetsp:Transcript_11349/g.34388  ORF Transcript_11349/g.34388 Transcript_11349/m.34388 type:complete len:231 (+) Transcript_11349:457-1149(+)
MSAKPSAMASIPRSRWRSASWNAQARIHSMASAPPMPCSVSIHAFFSECRAVPKSTAMYWPSGGAVSLRLCSSVLRIARLTRAAEVLPTGLAAKSLTLSERVRRILMLFSSAASSLLALGVGERMPSMTSISSTELLCSSCAPKPKPILSKSHASCFASRLKSGKSSGSDGPSFRPVAFSSRSRSGSGKHTAKRCSSGGRLASRAPGLPRRRESLLCLPTAAGPLVTGQK